VIVFRTLSLVLLSLFLHTGTPTEVTLETAQTVTLAWDANPVADNVTGYKVHFGTATGSYTTHVDVSNVTQWTTPVLQPATYFFVVTAYNATAESDFSAEVNTGVTAPPDDCSPPLGAHSVSVFITKMENTTGSVGSQARLNFQLSSPNSPIVNLTMKLNGNQVDTPMQGSNLNKTGGMWFTTPLQAGTYNVTLTASNLAGCSTVASKDALGKLLTVTVK
jgi:hypothetical protein